jgi:hypothetical protein
MMIMPGTENARREFKNIPFKIVSACEYAIGGGLCVLPQPSEEAGGAEKRDEEKKLGITMCGEGHEWGTCTGGACERGEKKTWPRSEDQCCEETCASGATNCAQCECDPTADQCTFNQMRAGTLGLPAFSAGRMMCSGGKVVMPKCKPPPKTNMCMPKIEYTATFESVSWRCPASKLEPATGPCVTCPQGEVADIYQEKCVGVDSVAVGTADRQRQRRTTAAAAATPTTADTSTAQQSASIASPPDAHDMSLYEETGGSGGVGTSELMSVGELARSVHRSHQVGIMHGKVAFGVHSPSVSLFWNYATSPFSPPSVPL